jgi:hypothetical protein
MPATILFDTVTLRHFACCNSLDILEQVCVAQSQPHWVEEVHAEVSRIAATHPRPPRAHCRYILAQKWLGDPHEAAAEDLHEIFSIRTALSLGLGGHPSEHLGEAQTIYLAEQLGTMFATDDGPAYDYAAQRLGPANVVDSIELLRVAVSSRIVAADHAAELAAQIQAAGRFFRKMHRTPLAAGDFQ